MEKKISGDSISLEKAIQLSFLDMEERLNGNMNISLPFLVGAPGCGKTAIIKAEALKRNWNFYSKNIGMTAYEEFSGIPENLKNNENELYTMWAKPQIVEDLNNLAKEKPTVCLLDDWHLSSASIQSMAFELFTEHRLKGYEISKNVMFILAGNNSVSAGAKNQLSAVLNRVSKKYIHPNFEYWKNSFALQNKIHPLVLGFLENKQNQHLFLEEENTFEPWASPRSWTYLSSKLHLLDKTTISLNDSEILSEFSSYVGTHVSAELHKFYKYYKTIDIKTVFEQGIFQIPNGVGNTGERYIFMGAILNGFHDYYEKYNENIKENKEKIEFISNVMKKIVNEFLQKYKELGIMMLVNANLKTKNLLEIMNKHKIIDSKMLDEIINVTMSTNLGIKF